MTVPARGKPPRRRRLCAYRGGVRGASRDDAIEEAEFLADDWSDETGAAARAVRGDDTSSDEEADFVSKSNAVQARFKRVRSGARAHTEKLVGVDVSDSDEDDFPPTQVIFCSRTHSQLTQVVGELRSTAFGRVAGAASGEEDRRLVSAVAVAAGASCASTATRSRPRARPRRGSTSGASSSPRRAGRREGRRAGARRRRRRATDAADATSLKTSRKRKKKKGVLSFASAAARSQSSRRRLWRPRWTSRIWRARA